MHLFSRKPVGHARWVHPEGVLGESVPQAQPMFVQQRRREHSDVVRHLIREMKVPQTDVSVSERSVRGEREVGQRITTTNDFA